MSVAVLSALSPWLLLGLGAALLFVLGTTPVGPTGVRRLATTLLVAAAVVLVLVPGPASTQLVTMLQWDGTTRLFGAAVLFLAAVGISAAGGIAGPGKNTGEAMGLVLLVGAGALTLIAAGDWVAFLLGLELMSVSLYPLIAFQRGAKPVEAGFKYLLLSGTGTAFVVFGIALWLALTGTVGWVTATGEGPVAMAFALILVGVGFKIALVPFHLWAADVYRGAPIPVAGLLAAVSKGAVLLFLWRVVAQWRFEAAGELALAVALLALASMLVGNLLALRSGDVVRMLAFSSIAHVGYLLLPLLHPGMFAGQVFGFYLLGYMLAVGTAFTALARLDREGIAAPTLRALQGVFWRRPVAATALAAALLSLAGLPVTVGFVAKLQLLAVGVDARAWMLLTALVVGSALGFYYYLRVLYYLFARPRPGTADGAVLGGQWLLAGMAALVVLLGVAPEPLLQLLRQALLPGS